MRYVIDYTVYEYILSHNERLYKLDLDFKEVLKKPDVSEICITNIPESDSNIISKLIVLNKKDFIKFSTGSIGDCFIKNNFIIKFEIK